MVGLGLEEHLVAGSIIIAVNPPGSNLIAPLKTANRAC